MKQNKGVAGKPANKSLQKKGGVSANQPQVFYINYEVPVNDKIFDTAQFEKCPLSLLLSVLSTITDLIISLCSHSGPLQDRQPPWPAR